MIPRMPVRTPDIVSKALFELNRYQHLSWRKIALLDDYSGIPPGTLSSIAKGYPVPRKWYARLGIREMKPAPVCLQCGQVHVTKRCTAKPRRYRDLLDMPRGELRRRLDQRSLF